MGNDESQRRAADSATELNRAGIALARQGKLDDAIACFRRAVHIEPTDPSAFNNLGTALAQQGKRDEGIANIRRALELKPDYAVAHNNLGNALTEVERLHEAVASCRRAIELKPDFAPAHNNLGNALMAQAKFDEASACFQCALHVKPDFAEAHNNLGSVFRHQGKWDLALACFEQAKLIRPNYAEAENNRGVLLMQQGNLAEAERSFRAALRIDPRNVTAWANVVSVLNGKLPDDELAVLLELASDSALTGARRTLLHFALAQVFDRRKAYADAAEHARLANSIALVKWQNRGNAHDPALQTRFVDLVSATFTTAFFERTSGFGVDSQRPIFVVGLPRSGTTLIEQILASHAQVFGADELPLAGEDFAMLAAGAPDQAQAFEAIARIDCSAVQRQAHWHLERLRDLDADTPRVVDKMPENYVYLGLLATLFPRAKFIHVRRDLRDVAVSCWMTGFTEVTWTNDFDHIASHLRDYLRAMAHWRQVLPVPLLEVDYEETVNNLESVARRLVAWCGLEWDPACLAFHETKRPVRTASLTQVRQPIHDRSAGRWKNYEQLLSELFARLP